jgi:hypothetical protein
MLLKKGRREASLIRPHPAPLLQEGGSSYETHHAAGKGVEDAIVRDNASGLTAATEPSDRLLARSVGGGGGSVRGARSNQGSSCRRRCSRR